MNLLQIYKGSKQYGDKVLFREASLSINEGEHIGVIGPNGAGKTTLFKILVGHETLDSGDIIKSQGLRIGYLEQESEWSLDQSSEEYLKENCTKPIWDLKQLGQDLGLLEEHFQQPLRLLSGGYRMRMKLLYLIGLEPNLMLLDEPTNFLDLESILSLERFLQNDPCAFLLISHDREFLRRTTESTLEVESGDFTKFPGQIDDYFEQKAQLQEILQAQAANLEAKRKHIQSFIDRFKSKATKAKQAQSRMKQLDKMESIEIKSLPVKAQIKIPQAQHTGKEIFSFENADLGYQSHVIIKNINFRIERGTKLGVVGFNGAGKSTFLKTLADRLPLISGQKKLGYQVSCSYFAQHVAEELNLEDSILECLQSSANSEVKAQEILNMAGSLLFSGQDIHKKVKVLSGGEKARVALGQILLRKSSLLILDEPTNHLDFDTVEALTEALRNFEGSLVVVSHDRSFIRRVATQILEIRNGHAEIYPGNYEDYVWSLEKGALKERHQTNQQGLDPKLKNKSEVVQVSSSVNFYEKTKRLQSEIRDLQRKITKSEEKISKQIQKRDEINQKLVSIQGPEVVQLSKEWSSLAQEIEALEEGVLEFMESLQTKENELADLKR